MKILLVAANSRPQDKPSLGLAYLASYARMYFSNIIFKYMGHIPKNNQKVEEFAPDIIGINALTYQIDGVRKWTRELKAVINVPMIIGGPHISACPDRLPEACEVGVIGEGEETFRKIIAHLLDNGFTVSPDALGKIKGVVFRNSSGEIIITSKRPPIIPLDRIPFPARDILDMDRYIENNVIGTRIGRGTFMFTSRGCPYNCVFCSSSAFWGKPRFNSPEYVINEMKFLINEYTPDSLHIYDDLFAFEKKRLGKIVELIEAEGINKKVEFGLYSRPDIFNEGIAKLLKRMNVVNIDFGFESGVPRVLKFLKSRTQTVEQSIRAVELCKKYGFSVNGSFIIGSPDETEEEMLATLEFIKKLDIEKFSQFILCPYPGTRLWEWAKAQGDVSDDMNFSHLDMRKKLGYFSPEDIERQIILTDRVDKQRFLEIYNLFEQARSSKFGYRWDLGMKE